LAFDALMIHQEDDTEEQFVCELDPDDAGGYLGIVVDMNLNPSQKASLRFKLFKSELISGESTYFQPGAIISGDNKLQLPNGMEVPIGPRRRGNRRKLSTSAMTGDKTILVVKVESTSDGVSPNGSDDFSSLQYSSSYDVNNKVFGTHGDTRTLKSQIFDCSMEALNFVPASGTNVPTGNTAGVIEIEINIAQTTKTALRNAALTEATNVLGYNPSSTFDYTMYLIRRCALTGTNECGWAAFAYINSDISFYQDNYWR
jgi:hypothetical protein